MKTNANAKESAKDRRVTYTNHRIEHGGQTWFIDAKADRVKGVLKVYRVHGDITDKVNLHEGLQLFADSEALSYTLVQ
jgi:hypothetical protein